MAVARPKQNERQLAAENQKLCPFRPRGLFLSFGIGDVRQARLRSSVRKGLLLSGLSSVSSRSQDAKAEQPHRRLPGIAVTRANLQLGSRRHAALQRSTNTEPAADKNPEL